MSISLPPTTCPDLPKWSPRRAIHKSVETVRRSHTHTRPTYYEHQRLILARWGDSVDVSAIRGLSETICPWKKGCYVDGGAY